MPTLETWVAGVIFAAVTIYVLGAGADFGGGVWDFFARGPRARGQRELIAEAIGPIWEANHVWLILVVVVLFVSFPVAFAALATALHVPLTLMLIGIVLRGSAFTFRTYDRRVDAVQRRWGRTFAMASIVTPVMLGVSVGAIASGRVRSAEFLSLTGGTRGPLALFLEPWLQPFPFAIGLFTLSVFAYLAAVYLTLETDDAALQDDFRRRAVAGAVAVGALAFVSLALARRGAPLIYDGLVGRSWSLVFQVVTGALALGAIAALLKRRFALARVLAIVQTVLILGGWAAAQYPYLVPPDLTIHDAAAAARVLRLLLIALAAGALLLFPSLWYLFRVFKGKREPFEELEKTTTSG